MAVEVITAVAILANNSPADLTTFLVPLPANFLVLLVVCSAALAAALEKLATWTTTSLLPLHQHQHHTSRHRHRNLTSGLVSNPTSHPTRVKPTNRPPSTATRYLLADTDGVRASTREAKVWSLAILFLQITSRGTRITTPGQEALLNHQLNSHLRDLMGRMDRAVHITKVRQRVVQDSGAAAGTLDGNRQCRYSSVD